MVCSATRVCVVDGKNFLETMRHEHVCFAIVPNDGKEEVEEVPIEVAKLLVSKYCLRSLMDYH